MGAVLEASSAARYVYGKLGKMAADEAQKRLEHFKSYVTAKGYETKGGEGKANSGPPRFHEEEPRVGHKANIEQRREEARQARPEERGKDNHVTHLRRRRQLREQLPLERKASADRPTRHSALALDEHSHEGRTREDVHRASWQSDPAALSPNASPRESANHDSSAAMELGDIKDRGDVEPVPAAPGSRPLPLTQGEKLRRARQTVGETEVARPRVSDPRSISRSSVGTLEEGAKMYTSGDKLEQAGQLYLASLGSSSSHDKTGHGSGLDPDVLAEASGLLFSDYTGGAGNFFDSRTDWFSHGNELLAQGGGVGADAFGDAASSLMHMRNPTITGPPHLKLPDGMKSHEV
eukprot:scaffold4820_cov28-Tisochrysis_lutea.AAC.5